MKRALIILAILFFASAASAQVWHPANQVTLAWDAVTMPDCVCVDPPCTPNEVCPGPEYPSPAAGEVKYQVYIRSTLVETGTKYGPEIPQTSAVISLNQLGYGNYFLGVESIAYYQGQSVGVKSTSIAWSDVAANCANGEAFGVTYWMAPSMVKGLRLQ